jgi:hypothetical protein
MFSNKYNKKNTKKPIEDTKGNWEFSFFQKKFIPHVEQNIKESMKPENSFDPKYIHQYINPQKSKEELIIEKSKTSKLTKTEQIIYDNYIKKKETAILEDKKAINEFGLNAKPNTNEGRTRLLLHTLQYQISKGNDELVCNIYLKLKEEQFNMNSDIEKDYKKSLNKMNEIVSKYDLLEMQFTKFYDQMPPLNTKGFQKFDPWQINVVNNIDKSISSIISAPTSAGKTVLSGYATTKGKTLIVVPTDALAWQMASYIGGILNADIPIVTQTYQSLPKRDLMIELINSAKAIVGTAETIVDYLPLLNTKFDWVIFDEIHMIGKPEGSSMEIIAKMFNDIPFLALSATIGNLDYLTDWFQSLNKERKLENIVCDKRFFNLQKLYYNTDKNDLTILHPLSLVKLEEFKDRTILTKSLQPTPLDTWNLYIKFRKLYYNELGNLEYTLYFDKDERIQLSKANKFFSDMIQFMVDNYNENNINEIITSFKNIKISTSEEVNLVKLAFLLKNDDRLPAIIFQKNTVACLRMVRQFAKIINEMEDKEFPRLQAQRLKEQKKARRIEKTKEIPDEKKSDETSKKEQKKFLDPKIIIDEFIPTAMQEPTPEYNINHQQYFTEGNIETWVMELKKYFPNTGDEYHFIIKLLWRGVGVYTKGLPDPYLRLVQGLASKKQLAIVFSDMSLVFGVSMPFRSVVIYRDNIIEDDLDPMLYHQMAGRAGRRGLDKKGNIIFAGYNWKRIEELSICPIPNIVGVNTLNFVTHHANKISKIKENNYNWNKIFENSLNKDSTEDNLELLENIKSNYENGWDFAINNDINHLHMMWILRNADEPIIISFIIPYLRKGFESLDPNVENNQVSVAHFLSHFINKYPAKDIILPKHVLFEQPTFIKIYSILDDLQLEIPDEIDGRVYESIKNNKLYKCTTEKESDELSKQLFEFGNKVKAIQHYCYHSKITNLSRLLGKLLTRIWWIYHMNSPIMKPFNIYDQNEFTTFE